MKNDNKIIKDKTITRLAAVQAIYLYDHNEKEESSSLSDITDYYLKYNPLEEYDLGLSEKINLIDKAFLKKIYSITLENLEQIDLKISELLNKQEDVEQLGSVLRAILRAGTCELLFFSTPYKVVINEYVTLARDFYNEAEVNFINGLLDKIGNEKMARNQE